MARVLFIIGVLAIAGVCRAADEPDSLEAGVADSLATGSADTSDTGGYETESGDEETYEAPTGGEGAGVRGGGSWFWGTHPGVDVGINKRKDVTNWETRIRLNRKIAEDLILNLNANLQTRENSTLNRSDSNSGTTANFKYKLNDNISFGVSYNGGVNAHRYDLAGGPTDSRLREDVSVSADLNRKLSNAVDVRFKTSAGGTKNSYASVSNDGTRQDMSSSVTFSPSPGFTGTVNYNAKRLILDSQVDSSGAAVFASKDRTFSQDLSASIKYDVSDGIKLSIDAARAQDEKQHPDPDQKKQETEERTSRRASVTSNFSVIPRVKWDLSVAFSDDDNRFSVRRDRNNATTSAALNGSMRILPWRGATLALGGTRETKRSVYKTADTGDDLHKSLSLKLSQDLGPKANMDLTALTDMVSVFYDDKQANPKDRDRLNSRISMGFDYQPSDAITTQLGGEYSEEQSVYVMAASSANNRTTRKYRVSGKFNVGICKDIRIGQDYDISAVYTFYHFGESQNNLVRNSNVNTGINIKAVRDLKILLMHTYKFQDEGSYREEGGTRYYGKSAERETHTLSINCRYGIGRHIKVLVKQAYQIMNNYRYRNGEKQLDSRTVSDEISGRISFDYDFGNGTNVSLSVEQNRKEGSRVSEAFRNYRDIEFKASRIF